MITGERIRNIREDKDILQQELANAVGINVSVLSRIEKGTRQLRDDELIKIADSLNVSVDYLLGRTDMNKVYTGYSAQVVNDPQLNYLVEQYPKLNDTAKAAINNILALAKAQQQNLESTTAERIGNKILDASPQAQAAVSEIIKNDKT